MNIEKKKYIAFFAMVVGMFMAILDIQIVASSLSNIGAGLSASFDELSWIQTSYLIAEVIVIPIAGFLTRLFSTRYVYFVSALGFTLMSIACALSWSIKSMIIFRLLQGLLGGLLIPITFSSIFLLFNSVERLKANIVVGLVVTMAPTLGPIIGGYLTENFSWHLMFLINVIPGIIVCTLVYLFLDFDKPNYNLLTNFDYFGIIFLSIGLGVLQYILEEGNKVNWFDSGLIVILSIISFLSILSFIVVELNHKNSLVDLRTFANINFTIGCIYSFIIGVGLYGVVFLLPMFLSRAVGMNSLQIGQVMVITGLAQFLSAPLASQLYARGVKSKTLFCFGLNCFGLGCYMNSFLTVDSRFYELLFPQIIRGISLMFCFIPMSNIALGDLSPEKIKSSSGLFNLMRNLGGAIGLALMSLVITRNTIIFSGYLMENISMNDPFYQNILTGINFQLLSKMPLLSDQVSLMILNNIVQKNAFIESINGIFKFLAVLFIAANILLLFVKEVKSEAKNNDAH
jgi:DHA2 family multidrug resistance protein